jgi:hypothetical protein
MSLTEKQELIETLRIEMNRAISEAKALHAPTVPLIYSIGNKAFFNLK